MMENIFFDAVGVSFSYYKKPLCLNSVSFSMQKGEKVLLFASNEMGKTTFLSVMSGFQDNYSGKIFFQGKNLSEISDEDKKFSFLPSKPVFFENKTVIANIKFAVKSSKNNQDFDEDNFLKKYDLLEIKNKKLKKLTLLEKRKLAIIRSEIKSPNILFLDDQFQELDSIETEKIKPFYEKLLNSEQTMIFSIDSETYKNQKDFLSGFNFSKILYLVDAKIIEFDNLMSFDENLTNINQLKFFDSNFVTQNGILYFENGHYLIYINENKQIKLFNEKSEKFNKLNLKNGDEEDIILVFMDNINIDNLTEEEFNLFISKNQIKIFSNIDGNNLI